MNNPKKNLLIALASFFSFIIIVSVVYIYFNRSDTNNNPTNATTYIDPGTGEVVYTIPSKTPENTLGHNITILGLTSLINDYGMTFNQTKNLRLKIEGYSSSLEAPFKEISITLSSIKTTINPDNGITTLQLVATLDRTSEISAIVEYFGIDEPTLTIYNPKDSSLIYKSK